MIILVAVVVCLVVPVAASAAESSVQGPVTPGEREGAGDLLAEAYAELARLAREAPRSARLERLERAANQLRDAEEQRRQAMSPGRGRGAVGLPDAEEDLRRAEEAVRALLDEPQSGQPPATDPPARARQPDVELTPVAGDDELAWRYPELRRAADQLANAADWARRRVIEATEPVPEAEGSGRRVTGSGLRQLHWLAAKTAREAAEAEEQAQAAARAALDEARDKVQVAEAAHERYERAAELADRSGLVEDVRDAADAAETANWAWKEAVRATTRARAANPTSETAADLQTQAVEQAHPAIEDMYDRFDRLSKVVPPEEHRARMSQVEQARKLADGQLDRHDKWMHELALSAYEKALNDYHLDPSPSNWERLAYHREAAHRALHTAELAELAALGARLDEIAEASRRQVAGTGTSATTDTSATSADDGAQEAGEGAEGSGEAGGDGGGTKRSEEGDQEVTGATSSLATTDADGKRGEQEPMSGERRFDVAPAVEDDQGATVNVRAPAAPGTRPGDLLDEQEVGATGAVAGPAPARLGAGAGRPCATGGEAFCPTPEDQLVKGGVVDQPLDTGLLSEPESFPVPPLEEGMLSQPFPSGDDVLVMPDPVERPMPDLGGCGLTGAVAICVGDGSLGGLMDATRR